LPVSATVIAIRCQLLCKTQSELTMLAVQANASQLLTFLMFMCKKWTLTYF